MESGSIPVYRNWICLAHIGIDRSSGGIGRYRSGGWFWNSTARPFQLIQHWDRSIPTWRMFLSLDVYYRDQSIYLLDRSIPRSRDRGLATSSLCFCTQKLFSQHRQIQRLYRLNSWVDKFELRNKVNQTKIKENKRRKRKYVKYLVGCLPRSACLRSLAWPDSYEPMGTSAGNCSETRSPIS